MTRDLATGLAVSALLHSGFLLAELLFPKTPITHSHDRVVDPVIEVAPYTPEPPEPVLDEVPDVPLTHSDPPPPSQADQPSVVISASFVQPVQPAQLPSVDHMGDSRIISPYVGAPTTAISSMKAFDPSDLDERPSARFQAKPVFPFEMRRQGVEGQVMVGFIVDSQGNVRDPYVISSSRRDFEGAAIQAVSKWKFRAGKKGGRAVNTRMQVPMVFSITPDSI